MIEVKGLTKYYGASRAIYDLEFTIESGQIAGFLGLNGAGKSTALKILAGYLLPTSGAVQVEGIDLLANPELLRPRIGFLPEQPPLYAEMTVDGFLSYLARLRGYPSSKIVSRVREVAERTALTDVLDAPISTLSLGYRRRAGIAQAIVHEPTLVILDEPISGLDPVQIVEMRHLIRQLGGDHTILISSHILSEVEETCDSLILLRDGELVAQGSEADLLQQFNSALSLRATIRGDVSGAHAALTALPLVTEVKMEELPGGDTMLSITLERDEPEVVASALVGSGISLRRLEAGHNQLEGLFLEVTSGKGAQS
jgi:ABC-2 type transport system ATP-binding protein